MIRSIKKENIFHAYGVPVLIGALLIKKKGTIPKGLQRITRLIMSCVTNAYMRSLGVDLITLLGASSWC